LLPPIIIGLVFYNKGKLDKALFEYKKALAIQERKAPNTVIIATSCNNI